jgi:hypothetical protein
MTVISLNCSDLSSEACVAFLCTMTLSFAILRGQLRLLPRNSYRSQIPLPASGIRNFWSLVWLKNIMEDNSVSLGKRSSPETREGDNAGSSKTPRLTSDEDNSILGENSAGKHDRTTKTSHSARGKPKDRGRRGSRRDDELWGPREDDGKEKAPRLPKRQCALLIGFSGTGYSGMQM